MNFIKCILPNYHKHLSVQKSSNPDQLCSLVTNHFRYIIGMFDVAVIDGYQLINIQVYSPYMRRFSQFQSFTHFGFLGKWVNSILLTCNHSALPFHYNIYKMDAGIENENPVLMTFFVHIYIWRVLPKANLFKLKFLIVTLNFLMLSNCNCSIFSPHYCYW